MDKLFHFATSHVFESEVAGKMCAEMCGSASKVNPIETLKKFIPHCTTIIENILEGIINYYNLTLDCTGYEFINK